MRSRRRGASASGATRVRPYAIHAVTNPTGEFTGSIHIYGGDFFAMARGEWRGEPYREQPYDADYVLQYFEEANLTHPG